MHFFLSSMSVVYVLTTSIPKYGENATVEQIKKRAKWDNDDYVCRGLILQWVWCLCLVDDLASGVCKVYMKEWRRNDYEMD
ncbi:hypothetical protein Tco_1211411 [Tanacetum coccineum]